LTKLESCRLYFSLKNTISDYWFCLQIENLAVGSKDFDSDFSFDVADLYVVAFQRFQEHWTRSNSKVFEAENIKIDVRLQMDGWKKYLILPGAK
jgi:hypothetical protein